MLDLDMLLLIRNNKLIHVYSVRLTNVTVNQTKQTDTGLFRVRLTHVTVNQKQQTDTGLFSVKT